MPANWARFGPGTLKFTVLSPPGTATAFEQEVRAVTVGHEYEEVGESVTYLDGTNSPPGAKRNDSLSAECDFDLGSTGLYKFLFTNDMKNATCEYVPNTAIGAKWSGTVRLQLPAEVAAEEWQAKLTGTLELPFVGAVVFTAGT